MANTLTGIFNTIVLPATLAAAQAPKFKNAIHKRVWTYPQTKSATVGQTVSIDIPTVDEADVIDIGNGDVQIRDGVHTNVPIVVNNNPSTAWKIPDFDNVRSPLDFQRLYMDAKMEAVLRKVNRSIANLATSFDAYTAITSTASNVNSFARKDVTDAWINLRTAGAPDSLEDNTFIAHHVPYGNMMGDTTWAQESVVGINQAEALQQGARFSPQYGVMIDYDQTMPLTSGGKYTALMLNRYAIGVVPIAPTLKSAPGFLEESIVYPGNGDLAFHVQMWIDPKAQGYIVHIHCIYGLAILRKAFGSLLQTA